MRIHEVSQQFNISIDTLRYYEKIGILDKVHKENGIRNYQDKDIDQIKFVQCMKQTGMTLDTISLYFSLVTEGDVSLERRLQLLTEQHLDALAQLKGLQASIAYLEYKMGLLKSKMEGSSI